MRALLVVAHVIALWPAAQWYVLRMTIGGGEAWGLAAAAAAMAVGVRSAGRDRRPTGAAPRLGLPTALLAAHGVAWLLLPPLFGAALGALSLATLVTEIRAGRRFDAAVCGLVLVALPDISTLQTFVGWPFRVGVAHTVAAFLRLVGVDAAPQGTLIAMGGRAIAVDAPCSGVWMGWGAALAWLVLAGAQRLGVRAACLGLATLVPVVFAANALRSLSLAVIEARGDAVAEAVPAWVHEGIGLIAFALVAVAVVLASERAAARERRPPCVARLST